MKFEISQQLFYLSRAKFSFVIQSECAYKGVRNCSDGNGCVLRDFFCDGMKDCTDGSDEDSCEGLFERILYLAHFWANEILLMDHITNYTSLIGDMI